MFRFFNTTNTLHSTLQKNNIAYCNESIQKLKKREKGKIQFPPTIHLEDYTNHVDDVDLDLDDIDEKEVHDIDLDDIDEKEVHENIIQQKEGSLFSYNMFFSLFGILSLSSFVYRFLRRKY